MDFFRDQERARSNSKILLLLFTLAVGLIIAAIYFLFLFIFGSAPDGYWSPRLFYWVAGGTLLVVAGGSLYKISQLAAGGGEAVARAMGARLVARETEDLLERRLLNVVDEMAIASGVTVPKAYIMDSEPGINAFAAGSQPSEAVVAVTRGCLEKLDRDELQGVIGHEFSHIFNGDMRLNLRLMGVLHGILMIAMIGRVMMHTRGNNRRGLDSRGHTGAVFFGLALFCIGYIGVFFGNLIKAAVSRQREFLADAAAVQYTRNPRGIAGALKKIGGLATTELRTPNAEQASHMFFAQAISSLFSTHPPIAERVARIKPAYRAALREAARESRKQGHNGPINTAMNTAMGFAVTPDGLRESVGTLDEAHLVHAQHLIGQLPESIASSLHKPAEAASILYALLTAKEKDAAGLLRRSLPDSQQELLLLSLQHQSWLRQSNRALWLPIVELALPALRELPSGEQKQVLACTETLIRADGRVNLFEYALLALLDHQLGHKRGATPSRKPGLRSIQSDINQLLSLLAHVGKQDPQQIERAFAAATALAPLGGNWQLLKPDSISLGRLSGILNRLNTLNYGFKGKLIEACTAAILENGEISLVESELLRAIGGRLECPVPPLLAGQKL